VTHRELIAWSNIFCKNRSIKTIFCIIGLSKNLFLSRERIDFSNWAKWFDIHNIGIFGSLIIWLCIFGTYVSENGRLNEISIISMTTSSCYYFGPGFLSLLNGFHDMIMLNFVSLRTQNLFSVDFHETYYRSFSWISDIWSIRFLNMFLQFLRKLINNILTYVNSISWDTNLSRIMQRTDRFVLKTDGNFMQFCPWLSFMQEMDSSNLFPNDFQKFVLLILYPSAESNK